MKWLALVKIFDRQMSGQWHSGSCDSYKSKFGLESREQAEEFINEVIERYDGEDGYNAHRDRYNKYELTQCILSYDESESENVEKFFRYM
jgi:hypothetical protein